MASTARFLDFPRLILILKNQSSKSHYIIFKEHKKIFIQNFFVNKTKFSYFTHPNWNLPLPRVYFLFSVFDNPKLFTIYWTTIKYHINIFFLNKKRELKICKTSLSSSRSNPYSINKWCNELSFSTMFNVTGNTS